MAREIKFRAMNEIGNWVYFSIWEVNPPLKKTNFKHLCEYIGSKDKNSIDIYDGDIVVNNNSLNGDKCGVPFIVYWDNDKKGWALKNKKYENPTWYFDEENEEIIGNIYKEN